MQSYFIQRIEKYLAEKHDRKIIGWDEILEGGLAPSATVMSWRGEQGGIAAASLGHDAIMTPSSDGMYIDQFQGDPKIEPVAIGGYDPLSRVYAYNPVPDTLAATGKAKFIKGVQTNLWSEYMYCPDLVEYRAYPRVLALAEIGWTSLSRKDYKDFERRLNNALVRLDELISITISLCQSNLAGHVILLPLPIVCLWNSKPRALSRWFIQLTDLSRLSNQRFTQNRLYSLNREC